MSLDPWNINRTGINFLPAKRLFSNIKEINSENLAVDILSLTLRGVVLNDPEDPEGLIPEDYSSYQFFNEGDLVFKLIDLENYKTSRVGILDRPGIMSPAYIRLVPSNKVNSAYAYWWFYFLYLSGVYNHLGAGVRASLSAEELLQLDFPYLELVAQKNLASKIEEIWNVHTNVKSKIEHQLENISLYLVGKIFRDVQNVRKYSQDKKLRYLLTSITTGSTPNESANSKEGLPWYSPGSIDNFGNLNQPSRLVLQNSDPKSNFRTFSPDSVLLVGVGATAGKVAYLDHYASSNQQITNLKPNSELSSKYLFYYLMLERSNILKQANYTTLPIINNEFIKSMNIILPPLEIQKDLVENWEKEGSNLTSLITKLKNLSELQDLLFVSQLNYTFSKVIKEVSL